MKKVYFEWDDQKDLLNQAKHGISFFEAQKAFLDPYRVIAVDLEHSEIKVRYCCFGKVDKEIMTVRFTYRKEVIRIIGAGFWRKGKKFMKKRKYTNETIRKVKIVKDFLPPPDQLVLKDETIKITLSLTKESVDFFKQKAKANHTQYQKMIRALIDQYVGHCKDG